MTSHYDAIILGAGAAGLMCAAEAGKRGKRTLLIEKGDRPGKKILISGGGRCNFTNLGVEPARYISANPHFAKSALSRYTPFDFLALVEAYGIAWHEKTLGQLFCDGSARQIVAMLVDEVGAGGGEIRCDQSISSVSHSYGQFTVATDHGIVTAPALVIATGGPSIPKMGATGFAYDLARQFGLKLIEPRPALVPLTLAGEDMMFRDLSGVATEVIARCGTALFREAALFTHRGLSGPAILQVSSYWRRGEPVSLNFAPDLPKGWLVSAKQGKPQATLRSQIAGLMPDRLAVALSERLDLPGAIANLSDAALASAETKLSDWRFMPNGSEGFAKAEVTIGGISTDELSSKTMESKRIIGLYAIGEAVDVTGWLGGYNFQWAWASGWAAGQAL